MSPNKIADLSVTLYNSLPKTGKPKGNEWTILSSIVQEGPNGNFTVVSLGTGSKCIGQSKMCPNGTILNDSHAEVICRRGFIRYLLSEINPASKIFNLNKQTNKFILKNGIKFHFFTTHVPCGDAAIFPKDSEEDCGRILRYNNSNVEPANKKRKIEEDIYRTGAKCLRNDFRQDPKGEGQDYHVLGAVRIKPGRGDPTQSVSCSDKLAKWCHLGLQGALLMHFLEIPVYFETFVILTGTPFSCEALERALSKRLGDVKLIKPYKRHVPFICVADKVDFCHKKSDGKQPCDTSIIWFIEGEEKVLEVAVNGRRQGVTKKQLLKKGNLTVCKSDIFKVFLKKFDKENVSYKEAKESSRNYQNNWGILKESFGAWTLKDPALLEFNVT
ncbi:tRNA-specific adenosine deaminase 1 [Anthonomus grandis grandis]|uniref:tRNA-specific adenosine deaminase 1 n=1 Tax=Anthonomus grandis grandis TaxID=2921223 RepID=UPI002165B7B3|nr:tRNA-specific adenosine deaminase 1 [Anthonomus grandis grandis]XP_050306066.1 tRNA-specific adenosine deaminase 1 [Anthonomus grandis grandis]